MTKKPGLMICALEDDVPPGTTIPSGVKKRPCHSCKRTLMMSRPSRDLVDCGRAIQVCAACAVILTNGDPGVLRMPPGGEEELRKWAREEVERN